MVWCIASDNFFIRETVKKTLMVRFVMQWHLYYHGNWIFLVCWNFVYILTFFTVSSSGLIDWNLWKFERYSIINHWRIAVWSGCGTEIVLQYRCRNFNDCKDFHQIWKLSQDFKRGTLSSKFINDLWIDDCTAVKHVRFLKY